MKSWAEISGARLVENLRVVQSIVNVGGGAETLGVIKANAYGHDAAIVARVLVKAGVRWLGVADVEEGARVRAVVGDGIRLLVMGGLEEADCKAVLDYSLTPVVWTVEHVEMLERAAKEAGREVRVHLEIDTGMARQGVDLEGVAVVAERLAESKQMQCEGVMSHLVAAEVEGSAVTKRQEEKLAAAVQVVVNKGATLQWLHLAATSAVDEGSTLGFMQQLAAGVGARVMVRPGIALYGYCMPLSVGDKGDDGREGAVTSRLKPVLTWKTRVVGIREIRVGETVGYGATFIAKSLRRLALLPVGYWDGFRRAGSSGVGDGWVMIAGRRAAVVGRVSMNLTVVDVTDMERVVGVGDEVVLIGEGVTADDHAQWSETISYEILCGIRAKFVEKEC